MRTRAVVALLACAACAGEPRDGVEAARARGTTSAAPATPPPADTSVHAFWSAFRAAALAGDAARVAPLTQFPLATRGPSDDDPVVRVSGAAFPPLLERLLRQDPGLRPQPETMRALLERTPTLGPRELGPDQARLGAFEFGKTRNGWRLVWAYVEE